MKLKVRCRSEITGRLLPSYVVLLPDDVEIELSTGLVDKEGNEIWENDTLEKDKNMFQAFWDDAGGCWSIDDGYFYIPLASVAKEMRLVKE